jgi:uncharacterized membrane protein
MRGTKIWHFALGLLLVWWGAMLMDWISFAKASDILGIGSIVTGVLALLDK